MHLAMNRAASLVSVFLMISFSGNTIAKGDEVYSGSVIDERVAKCGIIVGGNEVVWIQPYLEGRSDLEGRLVLNVLKQSATGTSRSSQASNFANGTLEGMSSSVERPANVTVEMIVMDRSGNTLCELRRSLMFSSATTTI